MHMEWFTIQTKIWTNLSTFKKKLKTHLFSMSYDAESS